jgi:hypothetical protein
VLCGRRPIACRKNERKSRSEAFSPPPRKICGAHTYLFFFFFLRGVLLHLRRGGSQEA